MFTEFESSIQGGFCSVVRSYTKLNNKYLSDYDPNKPKSSALFLDVNSLYATVLHGKLPTGDFYELTSSEIEMFDYENVDLDGDYCYALSIDFEIPDDVKVQTDDFPMSIKNDVIQYEQLSEYTKNIMKEVGIKNEKHSSLIASHEPREKYLISLKLLRLFLTLGMKCLKVHKVYGFKQEAMFKSYIEKNIKLRTNSTGVNKKATYKMMSNCIYGKGALQC